MSTGYIRKIAISSVYQNKQEVHISSHIHKEHIMATQVETKTDISKTFHYIPGYPLVGNLFDYRRDRIDLMLRLAREGDVTGLRFGPFPAILFNKPEHVHSILVQ